jgi:hypothetical protein
MEATFGNGKYRVIFNEKTGELRALRYGEEWRELIGDKLILVMLQDYLELKETISKKLLTSQNDA